MLVAILDDQVIILGTMVANKETKKEYNVDDKWDMD